MAFIFNLSNNSKKLEKLEKTANACFADIGSFDAVSGCEISVNKMEAGSKAPFAHKHKENEELWIVLNGKGSITVDGKEFPVKEGSVIKIAPAGARTVSADTDLEFLCIQTKANSLTGCTLSDAEIL